MSLFSVDESFHNDKAGRRMGERKVDKGPLFEGQDGRQRGRMPLAAEVYRHDRIES